MTTSTNEYTFLEEFVLTLASQLVGTKPLIEKFQDSMTKKKNCNNTRDNPNNNNERQLVQSFHLYWRSSLSSLDTTSLLQLMSTTSTSTSTSASTSDERPPQLFVDLTFSFDVVEVVGSETQKNEIMACKGTRPRVSLNFGTFLITRPKCTYVCGSALTMEHLESLAKQMKIELQLGLAGIMAEILKCDSQETKKYHVSLMPSQTTTMAMEENTESGQQQQQQMKLDLEHEDQESQLKLCGSMIFDVSQRTSEFDEFGMALFCRDLFRTCNSSSNSTNRGSVTETQDQANNSNNNSEEEEDVKRLFTEWWTKAWVEPVKTQDPPSPDSTFPNSQDSLGLMASPPPNEDPVNNETTTTTTTTNNNDNIKNNQDTTASGSNTTQNKRKVVPAVSRKKTTAVKLKKKKKSNKKTDIFGNPI